MLIYQSRMQFCAKAEWTSMLFFPWQCGFLLTSSGKSFLQCQEANRASIENHNLLQSACRTATIKTTLQKDIFYSCNGLSKCCFLNGPSSSFLTFLRALCQMDRLNKVSRFGKRSMWRAMSGIYPFLLQMSTGWTVVPSRFSSVVAQ